MRHQKFDFCRLPFAVNVMLNLSNVLRLLDAYLPVLGNSANVSVNSLSPARVNGQNGLANNMICCEAGK